MILADPIDIKLAWRLTDNAVNDRPIDVKTVRITSNNGY
jgi:hypothetical protein